MKQRILSAVIAICMMLMLFPTVTEAAQLTTGTAIAAGTNAVSNGLPAADAQGVITLAGDVTLAEKYVVDSTSLTINGNGYTISTAAAKAIEIVNEKDEPITVTLNNVTIENTANKGRCVDTRNDNITLNLNNVTLKAEGVNSQPLTIGGSDTGIVNVNIDSATKIDAGASGYGIITFVPNNLTINGTVSGYAALYMKDGSAGSTVTVNGTMSSANIYNEETNAFGTIVFEENGIELVINGTMSSEQKGTELQTNLLMTKIPAAKTEDEKVQITIAANANFTGDIAEGIDANKITCVLENNTLIDVLKSEGYSVVNGQVITATNVAEVDGVYYDDFVTALKAVKSGSVVNILSDITISDKWDVRNTGAKIFVPVTINGNGHTIKFTNVVNDGLNHYAAFRFEEKAEVNNLTVDMSEAISEFNGRFRAISCKADLVVNNCTFIGSTTYTNTRAIIFGEGAGTAVGNIEVSVKNSYFKDWRRGVSDNENTQDVMSVLITDCEFVNSSVGISAVESITFTGNKVSGGNISIKSYANVNELSVVATDNTVDTQKSNAIEAAEAVVQDEFIFKAVAEMNGKSYSSIQAAVNAAGTNASTITMLGDAAGNGFVVKAGQNIVFDFAGFTYTINGELVGSEGTKTLSAQLLKGATVTFKNGTLTSTNAKFIIQNYSDLTLENFNVDGTQSEAWLCTISNNNGSLTVKGDSDILGKAYPNADRSTLDLYYWSNGGYDTVNVVFDETYTGTVVGNITYGPDAGANASDKVVAEKLALTINGNGTFDVKFFGYGNDMAKANIQISGGTFTEEVPQEYLVSGVVCVPVQSGDKVSYVVHTHALTKTYAAAPSCVTDGNIVYWTCGVCTNIYSDEAATTKIETADAVIGATGVHTYLDGQCTMCKAADPDYKPDEKVEMGTTDTMEDTLNSEAANITDTVISTGELPNNIVVDEETEANIKEVVKDTASDNSVKLVFVVEQVATPIEEHEVESEKTTAIETKLDEAKQEIAEESAEKVEEQGIVQYLDLSVVIKAQIQSKNDPSEETKTTTMGELKETKEEMEFTITVPDEYLKPGYEVFILRYHDGKVDKLPLTHVEGNIYSFKTNLFSTYALAYVSTHVHTETIINAVEADCGNDGYTGDKVCSTCGEELQKGDVIKADGNHHWSEWKNQEGILYTFRECWGCGGSEYLNADTPTTNVPATGTGAPATGDTSNMLVWVLLMAVCCGAVIGIIVYRKKK